MKSAVSAITIIGFVGVAVLGFVAMNHNSGHGHSGCIVAITQGTACPEGSNVITFLNSHFNAFKNFSLATFGENTLNALLLAFVSLLFIGLGFSKAFLFRTPQLALARHRFTGSFSPPQKQELIHWLALHENSPAFF